MVFYLCRVPVYGFVTVSLNLQLNLLDWTSSFLVVPTNFQLAFYCSRCLSTVTNTSLSLQDEQYGAPFSSSQMSQFQGKLSGSLASSLSVTAFARYRETTKLNDADGGKRRNSTQGSKRSFDTARSLWARLSRPSKHTNCANCCAIHCRIRGFSGLLSPAGSFLSVNLLVREC